MRRLSLALLAAALILSACGGGGGKKTAARAASEAATTAVTDAPTTTTPSGPAGASAGAAPTTTIPRPAAKPAASGGAQSGSAPPSAAGPRPAAPLAPGTYRYDTTGSEQSSGGANRPMPSVTTLKADPANGPSQHTTRDLRDPNGQGQTVETVLIYQPDGVHVSEIKVTTVIGGGITDVRDLRADPPPLIARTGAAVGDHYDFTLTGSGTTFHGVITIERTEQLTVAGTPVTTAVVKLHVDFSGAVTGTQDATDWVDAAHLENVKEQVVNDAHAGSLATHTDYTATLQQLRPT